MRPPAASIGRMAGALTWTVIATHSEYFDQVPEDMRAAFQLTADA
jgi:hypothetical protein